MRPHNIVYFFSTFFRVLYILSNAGNIHIFKSLVNHIHIHSPRQRCEFFKLMGNFWINNTILHFMQMFHIFKRSVATTLFKWILGFMCRMSFNLDKILKKWSDARELQWNQLIRVIYAFTVVLQLIHIDIILNVTYSVA